MQLIGYSNEIWQKRFFWMSLVKADLRTRYRHSWLGIGWSLMHPLAMTGVFCIVFCKLFNADPVTFGPYVLAGLAFWNFLSGVTSDGCQCFFQGERFIRQQPAPLAIYPLRITLGMLIHLAMALAVLLVFVWVTQGFGNYRVLWSLLPTMVLLFAFGWSVTICMGMMNVVFQDTQHLIQIIIQALFYITPIFYPSKLLRDHNLGWIADYNPLARCIELIREPVLYARLPSMECVAIVSMTTFLLSVVAIVLLRRMEQRLIFYL